MAILSDILKTACQNIDIKYYDGTAQEVAEKIARTGKMGLKKYPAVMFFKVDANKQTAENEWFNKYSNSFFAIANPIQANKMTKDTDFEQHEKIKVDLFKQFAKDIRMFGLNHTPEHEIDRKYMMNGTDKLAVLEVKMNEIIIKKQC